MPVSIMRYTFSDALVKNELEPKTPLHCVLVRRSCVYLYLTVFEVLYIPRLKPYILADLNRSNSTNAMKYV